jgi:hypothetical protein
MVINEANLEARVFKSESEIETEGKLARVVDKMWKLDGKAC